MRPETQGVTPEPVISPPGDDASSHWRSPLHDYSKMLVVGAVGFAIDFGLFNLLLAWGVNAIWANLVALVVSGLIAFKANLDFTFAHREITNRSMALLRFAITSIVSILFVEVCVAIAAHYDQGVGYLNLIKAAATVLAVVARFVSYRHWVFR